MKIIIDMEVETPDYQGGDFMHEINELLANIRKNTGDSSSVLRLTKFKMRQKFGISDERDIDWSEDVRTSEGGIK